MDGIFAIRAKYYNFLKVVKPAWQRLSTKWEVKSSTYIKGARMS